MYQATYTSNKILDTCQYATYCMDGRRLNPMDIFSGYGTPVRTVGGYEITIQQTMVMPQNINNALIFDQKVQNEIVACLFLLFILQV